MKNKKIILIQWFSIPFSLGIFLLIILFTIGLNTQLFLVLNGLSRFGGSYLWANISILGDTLFAAVLILPFIKKRKDLIWPLLLAGILSLLVSHLLKDCLDVLRPPAVLSSNIIHVIGPAYRHHSFPSGHATTIFTIAFILIVNIKKDSLRWLFLTISLVIGLSRIVIGVHWPADIIGGFLTGWTSAFVGLLIYSAYNKKFPAINLYLINMLILLSAFFLLIFYNSKYEHIALLKIIISIYAITGSVISLLLTYIQNITKSSKYIKIRLKISKLPLNVEKNYFI